MAGRDSPFNKRVTVANMTLDELKRVVKAAIDERLTRLLGPLEISDEPDDDNDLTWDAIRAAVERHRWTPPPGSKSSLEFLREDREN